VIKLKDPMPFCKNDLCLTTTSLSESLNYNKNNLTGDPCQ